MQLEFPFDSGRLEGSWTLIEISETLEDMEIIQAKTIKDISHYSICFQMFLEFKVDNVHPILQVK
jgi:hypothetical protein